MEAILLGLSSATTQASATKSTPNDQSTRNASEVNTVAATLRNLARALEAALPLLPSPHSAPAASAPGTLSPTHGATPGTDASPIISAAWLLELCRQVPSALTPEHLARAVLEASQWPQEDQQQAALFDVLGDSEAALNVLLQIAPHLSEIRQHIRLSDLHHHSASSSRPEDSAATTTTTWVDVEEERRQLLLQEAMDAAQVAAIARAEVEALAPTTHSAGTHTVMRQSEIRARKWADKAQQRADLALQRAREAGALVDEADLLAVDRTGLGDGGLIHRTPEEIWALQQSLLPEGSRQYYDSRGLPHGSIREEEGDLERVIIPPVSREEANLPPRLKIADIMDADLAKAFEGTSSLNPMQSSVFEEAFHSRDNVLVCAPTGAGKTNVAMLTVVAHFRDVGLIGTATSGSSLDIGKKVVYIAPMKALAQEVVEKFASKLKSLGMVVRELTGDMQLTRAEAETANVLVTTPEKWDVVTRKSGTDDMSLGNQCGLLIIDEVHLLADERGAVIESVVSRLHRSVESRQRQVRIVALSATLPNYEDVASFLQVPDRGLFFFGPEHRPVPLRQQFIGINLPSKDRFTREKRLNEVCYDVAVDALRRGHQVMVFVHSRKGTSDTATALADIARNNDALARYFTTQGKEGPLGEAWKRYADKVAKSRNRELGIHFDNGIGIHHAGMMRADRKLTEQMFADAAIRVLCCTATLAWGINLPARAVIIRGTEVYNPEKGGVVDLSILDVQQIFGRAGRPQFDNAGEATLITTHDAFPRYMNKLVRPVPIESNFTKQLADHLNAEIVGGTVTNLKEAAIWLTYTYLYVRMLRNPLAYGISADKKADDPMLRKRCHELVEEAAKYLLSNEMVRYDPQSGNLSMVENGRVAAHFYIQAETISTFRDMLTQQYSPTDADLCRLICSATEFRNMKVRQEEMDELETLIGSTCPLPIKGAGHDDQGRSLITGSTDKAFVLLQVYISRHKVRSFTLVSDMNYIAANAGRIARALFEIMLLKERRSSPSLKLLRIAKSIDKQIWWFQTPLRQFEADLGRESVFTSLEMSSNGRKRYDSLEATLSLLDMQASEVGQLCRWNANGGDQILRLIGMLPHLDISCTAHPVTTYVLRFDINLMVNFEWNGRWHGGAQSFWLWVEDGESEAVLHHEFFTFSRRTAAEPIVMSLSIPMFERKPSQYFVRIVSESWAAVEQLHTVSLRDIVLPRQETKHTNLLDLTPLPKSALQNKDYENLYSKFNAFNPIQTQLFHVLYHTDSPVLLGAPTGSGKTIVAELAIFRMKSLHPRGVCVYIAPMKALARERLKEWKGRFGAAPLHWSVLELSGDTNHDRKVLERADILICTPEKWDLISRGWRGNFENILDVGSAVARTFIGRVRLLVLDEVHLLGEERGAVLEAIVSRTRFIAMFQQKNQKGENSQSDSSDETRIIGLSTALANAADLANWIGIDTEGSGPTARRGLYNFKPSVRPVPTKVHVQGYPGKHYCPRMATMNKPIYAAIKELSPVKPVLIFVASRRQTRLTAFDIISYSAADENPKQFLHCSESKIEAIAETISDEALKHTLLFGIGLHHAGLSTHDRDVVERLYLNREIQVLVATATLAWGVNLPCYLAIIKGTEFFDGKTSRYVDYPLTDVLQMIGRAGRPGFDDRAEAVVMVAQDKKDYYKKFLYLPFPVESCLADRICENLNAEISGQTINTVVDALGYMTWTFFARRAKANPSYYGAESGSEEHVEALLLSLVKQALEKLSSSGCIIYNDGEETVKPAILGKAACNYYLSHQTPAQMQLGVREARKIIMNNVLATDSLESADSSGNGMRNGAYNSLVPFLRSKLVDEVSAAWLFYSCCSTHEFDELPVRHNEDSLNEELSEDVKWGADTSILLSGNRGRRQYNPDIFQDPHTKCFLLVQAYLQGTPLPISDYVNDTKSVIENLPRLLAAMQFIAYDEASTAGALELLSQFARTKQFLETRSLVDDDPLLQLPGFSVDLASRIAQPSNRGTNQGKESTPARTLLDLRMLERKEVVTLLQKITRNNKNLLKAPLEVTLDALFALPLITMKNATVECQQDKTNGNILGRLKLTLEVSRIKGISADSANLDELPLTLNILVGSFQQRFLLAHGVVRITRNGSWTIDKELSFDWSIAIADGGQEGGCFLVRLLFDEIRGLDLEGKVKLR